MLLCLLCGSSFIAHWFTINAIILRPITKMVHWSEWLINCVLQHINSTVVKRHLWVALLGVVNEDVVSTYHEGNCSMWLLAEMSAQCDIRVLMISMTCEVHGHYSVRLTRTIASGEGTDAPYQLRWLILSVTYDKDGCMLSGVANEAGCPDACSECNARNDARCDSRWRIQVHCVGTHLYIFLQVIVICPPCIICGDWHACIQVSCSTNYRTGFGRTSIFTHIYSHYIIS